MVSIVSVFIAVSALPITQPGTNFLLSMACATPGIVLVTNTAPLATGPFTWQGTRPVSYTHLTLPTIYSV